MFGGTPSPRGLGTLEDSHLPASSLGYAFLFFFFLTRVWKGRTLTAALPAGFAEGPHDSSTVRGAEGKGLGLQGMHKVLCGAVMSW